jgi:hypothetical protein
LAALKEGAITREQFLTSNENESQKSPTLIGIQNGTIRGKNQNILLICPKNIFLSSGRWN